MCLCVASGVNRPRNVERNYIRVCNRVDAMLEFRDKFKFSIISWRHERVETRFGYFRRFAQFLMTMLVYVAGDKLRNNLTLFLDCSPVSFLFRVIRTFLFIFILRIFCPFWTFQIVRLGQRFFFAWSEFSRPWIIKIVNITIKILGS